MGGMRIFAAAAFTVLSIVAAGCGGSSSGVASGAALGTGAANLVPADASAFASVDTDLGSQQWTQLSALTKDFPAREFVGAAAILRGGHFELQAIAVKH